MIRETVNTLENELSVEERLELFGYGCALDVQHNYSFYEIFNCIEKFMEDGSGWKRLHN